MRSENDFEDDIDGVPVSALLHEQRSNRYGSVPGLDDDELADLAELERQVYLQEFGPVLALPWRGRTGSLRPSVAEDGSMEWGAFGTVDFDRMRPNFDRAQYKADKLRDELENVVIMLGIVKERLPVRERNRVLHYLHKGLIQPEHIVNDDMRALVQLRSRARRLQEQQAKLREVSRDKLQREMTWLLT